MLSLSKATIMLFDSASVFVADRLFYEVGSIYLLDIDEIACDFWQAG